MTPAIRVDIDNNSMRTSVYSRNGLDASFHRVSVALSSVKRWDSKELRMPGCVSIADSDEHTAEVALVNLLTIFLPEVSEDPLGVARYIQQYQADDRWPSRPRGGGQSPPSNDQLRLECSDPHGPLRPTPMCTRLSAAGERPRFFKGTDHEARLFEHHPPVGRHSRGELRTSPLFCAHS